jgi:cellobiose-specific phosphotransferase system component IIB
MILLISSDLMVISTVENAAKSLGLKIRIAAKSEGLSGKNPEKVSAVVVDLETVRENIASIVSDARTLQPQANVIAFGPHVKTRELEMASTAGCDQVMPRGQFLGQLNSILMMAPRNEKE